jgi:hypothetical protein
VKEIVNSVYTTIVPQEYMEHHNIPDAQLSYTVWNEFRQLDGDYRVIYVNKEVLVLAFSATKQIVILLFM